MCQRTPRTDFATDLLTAIELEREAERMLGERMWRLVRGYGRVMAGPYSGLYVSGLPFEVQRDVLHRLVAGETLLIHLMHRHRSGNYESSSLRWEEGKLIMVYADREVQA